MTEIQLTDEIRMAYAKAWYRAIGLDEQDVVLAAALEVANSTPQREAALKAVLSIAEREIRERILLSELDRAKRQGYEQAIASLAGVAERTGSPAAHWAANYLAEGPDRMAPGSDAPSDRRGAVR